MRVKCILGHEKPIGIKYEAGKVYEKDIYDPRFFVPIEIKIKIGADPVINPSDLNGASKKIKKIIKKGRIGTRKGSPSSAKETMAELRRPKE